VSPEERSIALRVRIVAEALTWLGTPYRLQGACKGSGADCLGLVRGVYAAVLGVPEPEVPPYPPRLPRDGGEPLLEAAERRLRQALSPRPGDVLLFRMRRSLPAGHCGILLSQDRFIHAHEGRAVLTSALGPFWRSRIAGVFSIPEHP